MNIDNNPIEMIVLSLEVMIRLILSKLIGESNILSIIHKLKNRSEKNTIHANTILYIYCTLRHGPDDNSQGHYITLFNWKNI